MESLGEHYAACNIVHHDWFSGGSVMDWGRHIHGGTHGPLQPSGPWVPSGAEYAGSSWWIKELIPLNGPNARLT